MEQKTVYPHQHGSRLDVVVLSREGERVISRQPAPEDLQRFHSGLVKAKELAHDAAIYPAYLGSSQGHRRGRRQGGAEWYWTTNSNPTSTAK